MQRHSTWLLALLALLLAALLFTPAALLAQTGLVPVPPLSAQVIDQTGTLSPSEQTAITQRLQAIEQQYGSQVVVLLVASTQPEDIAPFAHRVADAWKIGRADVGDGLLLVVAKDDRTVRFEVARALEGTLPDILAARIIDQRITPGFRNGDFAGGILAGIDAIEATLAGEEALPPPSARTTSGGNAKTPDWPTLLIVAYFALTMGAPVLRQWLGRKLGALASGSAVAVVMYLLTGWLVVALVAGAIALLLAFTMGGQLGVASGGRRGGRGGWGGGSGGFGGGGGFRSGGGGSFGGGGASGRW